ncbi:MAG: hypothetical protein ACRCZI_02070 [Cetobacterium sp.]
MPCNNYVNKHEINIDREIKNILGILTNKEIYILKTEFSLSIQLFVRILKDDLYIEKYIKECAGQQHLLYSINNSYTNITRFLVKLYLIIPNIITPAMISTCIITSIITKQFLISKILMESFINRKNEIDIEISSILFEICNIGNLKQLKLFIHIDSYYPIPFHFDYYYIIFIAVVNNHVDVVRLLLNTPQIYDNITLDILEDMLICAKTNSDEEIIDLVEYARAFKLMLL